MESQKPKQSLGVPIAIVIAGLLIASAVFLSNKSGGGAPKTQSLDTVLLKIAKSVDLDSGDFKKCLVSGKYKGKVSASVEEAASTGGRGTPWSIVVGPTGKKYSLSGAQSADDVKALIDMAIKGSEPNVSEEDEAAMATLPAVTSTDHIKGSISAPVKIVEYSDLECPFCKMFHATLQEVVSDPAYKDKVAWIYRHFPLTQLHSKAPREAEATECAAEIGGNDGFWKFVDKLNEITPANNRLDQAEI